MNPVSTKEMKNVFKILLDIMKVPIVFDINIMVFWQNDRLAKGVHIIDPSAMITDACMVSRKIVLIALTNAVLKDMEESTANILHAQAMSRPEFREDTWKTSLIGRVLFSNQLYLKVMLGSTHAFLLGEGFLIH